MKTLQWQIPHDLLYDRNNYWVKQINNQAIIGFTDYGQYTIGDILFLELARLGESLAKGADYGSIESGKWVGKLVAPVSGKVLEVNNAVLTDPRLVNLDPYVQGWLLRLELDNPSDLSNMMVAQQYQIWVEEQQACELEVGMEA